VSNRRFIIFRYRNINVSITDCLRYSICESVNERMRIVKCMITQRSKDKDGIFIEDVHGFREPIFADFTFAE